MPSRAIAQRLEQNHDTIKDYLGGCGATIKATYYLHRPSPPKPCLAKTN
jgi:hypothetical protein